MAAAAEVLALAEMEQRQNSEKDSTPKLTQPKNSNTKSQHPRVGSTLSDSTLTETDPCESDTSGSASSPSSARTSQTQKKRRSESPDDNEAPRQKSKPLDPDTFPAEALLDLAGSTSAEVRRMNDDERALVHYKRRLRNRESAKRSRARRQATISDIQGELEDLRHLTANLVDKCMDFSRIQQKQQQEIITLRKEKQLLESMLRSGGASMM